MLAFDRRHIVVEGPVPPSLEEGTDDDEDIEVDEDTDDEWSTYEIEDTDDETSSGG